MSSSMPASLSLRIASALYDVFPLIALWMLSAGLALLIVHGRIDVAHPPALFRFGLRAALLVVSAAYFVISWSRGGQTIGMRAWRLRVVAADGNALSSPRALLRFTVALVSLAACAIGFLWCVIDPGRRTWHDLAARSAVIRIPSS